MSAAPRAPLSEPLSAAVIHSKSAWSIDALVSALLRSPRSDLTHTGRDAPMGAVLAVFNSKGGVGKSTASLAIASIAARGGKAKVLLVDADGQGNASNVLLGNTPRDSGLFDLLDDDTGEVLASKLVRPAKNSLGVYVLPGDRRLAKLEKNLSDRIHRESVLRERLSPIVEAFDLVVIDCPPALGLVTLNALVAADGLLCPLDTSTFSLDALAAIEKTARLVKAKLNGELRELGAFIGRVEKKNSRDFKKATAQFEAHAAAGGMRLIDIQIPATTKVPEAHRAGACVTQMFPDENVSIQFKKLTNFVMKEVDG